MKGLQDKVALVTGGSSGIGQAIAIRLGEEGANVAINYVGRPEGAISTREAIEHGVEICMEKMSEAGGRPIRSPRTSPTSRPWIRCSTGCSARWAAGHPDQ